MKNIGNTELSERTLLAFSAFPISARNANAKRPYRRVLRRPTDLTRADVRLRTQ